jgi:hypothetical protein
MDDMPPNVQCAVIDIDESFDVYAFLKSKKMVQGIPAILCYKKGNVSYAPDQVVLGADMNQVSTFFSTCRAMAATSYAGVHLTA